MTKTKPPTRLVVRTEVGPRSQRLTFPDGSVAIVCGAPLRTDTLECGHRVVTYGGRATRRRCKECTETTGQLSLNQEGVTPTAEP